MSDEGFTDPRLVALYDVFDCDRSDLDAYLAIADEVGARCVVDIGCGTGVFALLLAARGVGVTGVDPAAASLDIARGKPGAQQVRWIDGDASAVPDLHADLATMTGNVAQAIMEPQAWASTLRNVYRALRPGGHLVFETRDPAARAWDGWNRDATFDRREVAGEGIVETWCDLLEASLPLVSFRWTCCFADGTTRTSDSTLRFRERDEVAADLHEHGFELREVRGAPDRPGKEFVFLARRTG